MSTVAEACRTETRRVRVTLEGVARRVSHTDHLWRLSYPGGSVLVDDQHAVMDEVTGERVWTDGDVVHGDVFVWTRAKGEWWTPGHMIPMDEGTITEGVAAKELKVIRYQQDDL